MGNFKIILFGILLILSYQVKAQQAMFFGLLSSSASSSGWDIEYMSLSSSASTSYYFYGSENINDGLSYYATYSNIVAHYSMSPAYNVSSFSQVRTKTLTLGTSAFDVAFNNDGTRMFVLQTYNGSRHVVRYDLSTAYNTTNITANGAVSVSQDGSQTDIVFNPEGTKLYILGMNSEVINYYSLGTPWDISTLSYQSNISVNSTISINSRGLYISNDGKYLYIADFRSMHMFEMTEEWDISTLTFVKTKTLPTYHDGIVSFTFSNDGKTIVILDDNGNLYKYIIP